MKLVRDPDLKRRRAERKLMALQWGQLTLGMAVMAVATALLLDPRVVKQELFWVAWAVGFLAGLALVLSGVGARDFFAKAAPAPSAARRTLPTEERRVPRLGEMLVHHYKLISEEQLEQALTERRRSGQPIGQTVVAMGLITPAQLDEVLEKQLFYREHYASQPWHWNQ